MTKMNLEAYGVSEMNVAGMREIDGGITFYTPSTAQEWDIHSAQMRGLTTFSFGYVVGFFRGFFN